MKTPVRPGRTPAIGARRVTTSTVRRRAVLRGFKTGHRAGKNAASVRPGLIFPKRGLLVQPGPRRRPRRLLLHPLLRLKQFPATSQPPIRAPPPPNVQNVPLLRPNGASERRVRNGPAPRIGQSVSTLPTGYDNPRTSTAEVRVHPSGKFLYGSNRGHDSIAMFSIDKGGSLKTLGHAPVQGKTPRNFTVDPSGKFLLVANQDSDNLVLFQVQTDGILKPTGTNLPLSMPVCVRFLSLSKR